jgi:hypothetical protein
MSWSNIGKYYGFHRPFDFKVCIPLLLNSLLFSIVLALSAYEFARGYLDTGTARFYFYCYLALALFIAAAFSRITAFSLAIAFWCTVELGLGSLAWHGIYPLLPRNQAVSFSTSKFKYHPLLQGVPKPSWTETQHIEVSADVEARDPIVNWQEYNHRDYVFTHNSLGLRGAELNKHDLEKDMIFVYGGSTTYDLGVTQGATWVERLQRELGDKYTVLNFGAPGYSTTEHLIQTAFYESIEGKKPICAVYYIGWNDIRNAHLEGLDRAYADYHLPSQISNLTVRKPSLRSASYSPLASLFYAKVKQRFDSLPEPPNLSNRTPGEGSDTRLEDIFVEHIRTIAAINSSRNIRTVFIGQILNRAKFTSLNAEGWTPLIRNKDLWNLQERFNGLLEQSSTADGAYYIDANIDNFRNSDFVDNGHFSATGSAKFAESISEKVAMYCDQRQISASSTP